MAFLDNSGDIILDAVLTDTGRLRLAQGDGSFKITKFALGDDEINYGLYNKDHLSGSAYYDLEVLQTPILEAFTNNTSNLKTKLITIARTNILYMPTLKLNKTIKYDSVEASAGGSNNPNQDGNSLTFARKNGTADTGNGTANKTDGRFYIAVDTDTYKALFNYRTAGTGGDESHHKNFETDGDTTRTNGLIQGFHIGDTAGVSTTFDLIRIDQGLNTTQIAPAIGLDSDLIETAFIIETDYRLGRVKEAGNSNITPVNFIDDDNIATYYVTAGSPYVNPTGKALPAQTNSLTQTQQTGLQTANPQVFDGPRGNTLHFRIHASTELQQSTYLFTQIGSSESAYADPNVGGFPTTAASANADLFVKDKTIYYIDSTIRVVGANTGYRLDIPVRYIKIK